MPDVPSDPLDVDAPSPDVPEVPSDPLDVVAPPSDVPEVPSDPLDVDPPPAPPVLWLAGDAEGVPPAASSRKRSGGGGVRVLIGAQTIDEGLVYLS